MALAGEKGKAAAIPSTFSVDEEVYVWQRAWTTSVREAVADHGGAFSNIIALAAEVSWSQGKPAVSKVPLDFGTLAKTGRPIGLALRIGPFSGPFDTEGVAAKTLASLAASIVSESKAEGIAISELQLDFDCAGSKLPGYTIWVETIRSQIKPVPLTITALPSWMRQTGFHDLVAAADGYVLQVHSLEKPAGVEAPFTLCDPQAALAAVEKAASFGIPFRVALPTYGYLMAFSSNGQFVGLSAEGPAKSWPANARLREVRSDPVAMAALTRTLVEKPPPNLRGILWYRLPTAVDNLNWRWPTLGAIIRLQPPRESVRTALRRVGSGLVEISLVNDGELDISSRLAIEIRWQKARLVAGDGLRGFDLAEGNASSARLENFSQPKRLAAGEQWTIGWLRFNRDAEVRLEMEKK